MKNLGTIMNALLKISNSFLKVLEKEETIYKVFNSLES